MKGASLFASILFGSTLLTSLVSGDPTSSLTPSPTEEVFESMRLSVGPKAQCSPSTDNSNAAQTAFDEYASFAMTQFKAYCYNNVTNASPLHPADQDCNGYNPPDPLPQRQLGEATELEPLDRPNNRKLGRGCPCCPQNSVYCATYCAAVGCRRRLEEGDVTINDSRNLECGDSEVPVCRQVGTLQDAVDAGATETTLAVTDKMYPVTQAIDGLGCTDLTVMRLMYCPRPTNLPEIGDNLPVTPGPGGMNQSHYLDLCQDNPSDVNCVYTEANCTVGNRNNQMRCCRVFPDAVGCPFCNNTIVNKNRCKARGYCCQSAELHGQVPPSDSCPSDVWNFPADYPSPCDGYTY